MSSMHRAIVHGLLGSHSLPHPPFCSHSLSMPPLRLPTCTLFICTVARNDTNGRPCFADTPGLLGQAGHPDSSAARAAMEGLYFRSLSPSTSVHSATPGCFTTPDQQQLLVAKPNTLEVWQLSDEVSDAGLVLPRHPSV